MVKKKIALCFSGGVRNFKQNYKSIFNNLIKPLQENLQVDIFIHGWYFKVDQLENTHKMYLKNETPKEEVIDLLKPKLFNFEIYDKNKEEELKRIFKFDEIKEKFKDNKQLCELYPNTCGMFWSISQSNLLKQQYEKKNKFKYDYVVRCRPDFTFYSKLTLDILSLLNNSKNTILMPLDNYAFYTKTCDKFAIGDSYSMDYYSDLINFMNSYSIDYPKEFWDGPAVLNRHLTLKKINIKWIYFDYDYLIRRKSQRLSSDNRKKVDYDSKTNLIIIPKQFNFS